MLMEKVAECLTPLTGLSGAELLRLLEYPPNEELGDVAFPCFTLARSQRKSPARISQELADTVRSPLFAVQAAGPYLNFRFDRRLAAERAMADWRRGAPAGPNIGEGRRIVIDMSSPNIAKPFGIGHLRSTMIGNALYHILRRVGYDPVRVNHLGDWGTQFGKMIVAYLKWGDPDRLQAEPIKGYLELYVRFHREVETQPELEDEARAWFQKLEAGDREALDMWNQFIAESLKEFRKLYRRLGVEFDHYLGESFYNDKMEEVIRRLKERGLLEESDGAQVVRLDDKRMPPCLIVKSDGTSIYATRDLATAIYRRETMQADRLLYVVGAEQSLHFQQVFAVLEKLGYDWAEECRHVPFGLMKIEGRKMSTRKGKVVFLEDVLDEAVERALAVIEGKNPALPRKREVAEAVGVGAVVFGDLKNTRTLEVDFTLDEVLNFEGETGPYLQYTHARARSILRKAGAAGRTGTEGDADADADADAGSLTDAHSWQLIKWLSRFPEQLAAAADRLEPSILARYLIDAAQSFNRYYHHVRILAGSEAEMKAKLALVRAAADCLEQGLALLGLAAPEEI